LEVGARETRALEKRKRDYSGGKKNRESAKVEKKKSGDQEGKCWKYSMRGRSTKVKKN